MNKIIDRDHEAQRCAWAVGWFLSLLKARRRGQAAEVERARDGLNALGISVRFEEDERPDEDSRRKGSTDV